MDNDEILDQLGNLRIALALAVEQITPADVEGMLVACSIFIAGFDAMLAMRKES